MANFGDLLRAKTKTKAQLDAERDEARRKGFEEKVRAYVDELKRQCLLAASMGNHTITTSHGRTDGDGYDMWPFSTNSYEDKAEAKQYAEAVCAQLRSEGMTADYRLIREAAYRGHTHAIRFTISW